MKSYCCDNTKIHRKEENISLCNYLFVIGLFCVLCPWSCLESLLGLVVEDILLLPLEDVQGGAPQLLGPKIQTVAHKIKMPF